MAAARLSPFAQKLLDSTDVPFQSLRSHTYGARSTGEAVENGAKAKSIKRGPAKRSNKKDTQSLYKTQIQQNNQCYDENSSIEVIRPPAKKQHPHLITPPSKASDTPMLHNNQSYNKNSSVEATRSTPAEKQNNRLVTPSSKPLDSPTPKFSISVELPRASEIIRREEYAVYNEKLPSPSNRSSKKRKLSAGNVLEGPDQREQADAAFRDLQEYLQSIFEAEDNPHGNQGLCNIIGDEILSLTATALSKVQILLQKIISLGKFSQLPIEDILRLQKLCDGAVRATGTINFRFDESWEQSDMEAFQEQLSIANIGLKSARISLRIMTGRREEKQLYSEEIIQTSVNALNNVLDSCIVPVVELRDSGSASSIFKLLSAQKKTLRDLLIQCQRTLGSLRDLVSRIELSETVINTLEYAVSRLIFVENAHNEKDSVLGVGKFDNLRVVAMDTLAQIFSSHNEQRMGILGEILTSLEKLPVAKQSARQFKLASGGSIQLVSALIMRLIQTSANKSDAKSQRHGTLTDQEDDADGDDDEPAFQIIIGNGPLTAAYDTETRAYRQPSTAIQELKATIQPLLETAKSSASYVVNFIVQRAMKSTKTGDAPYRNLLDLFVQDFITCLNSTDWPAAELLLRIFLFTMISLAENDKTPNSAKNMALELLGEMGAAISQLNSNVRKMAGSLELDGSDAEVSKHLTHLLDSFGEDKLHVQDLVAWEGPYHISLAYLDNRYVTDFTLQSAVGYHAADWASHVCDGFDLPVDENQDREQLEQRYGRVAYRLRMMINDKKWLSTEYNNSPAGEPQAKLAYALTLLNSPFCRAFNRVLMILLNSTDSEQAMVRSKGLRSFNLLLETDPTILDRGKNVIRIILNRSNDPSVQVRDSALGLIFKCIGLRPALENEALPAILRASGDSNAGVRKRAIKLLKEIYLRNADKDVRTAIADSLLHRAKDPDEGVQELARQVIEEIWMSPFYERDAAEDMSAQYRIAVADHVALMVKTIQRSPDVSVVLDKVLQSSLSNASKNAAANFKVCKTFVATMFDTIIADPGLGGTNRLEAKDALQLLMTFAKANAKLFTTEQIQLLEPYIADVKTENDIAIFRPVIVIFRHVFPQLSTLHSAFLISVRTTMMRTVTRMNRTVLDDIFACLRIMSEVLENNDNLARLISSTIDPIRKFSKTNFSDPKEEGNMRKVIRLFLITGMCGKHCDLDNQIAFFQQKFPSWKGTSVSKLMVDSFAPFASPSQPLEIRKAALDAIGLVCQSWPKNYNTASISTVFQAAFEDKVRDLESVIMRSFKEFFLSEEGRSDPDAEPTVGAGTDTIATLGVMGGSQHDGVSAFIHQKFMPYLTRIALASEDDHALLATEILTSINRQGLNHPKECGPTFIALETSTNAKIADLAFREHRSMHQKHETIMEKEYMRAVQSAFTYQHDVVKDTRGAITGQTPPYTAKLHLLIDVLNISKVKTRKKFYESLCARIDFDPAKLDASGDLPVHLEFSRFIIENMAFFEYSTIDELLAAISAMEKVVTSTGSSVAHAIEIEIFSMGIHNVVSESAEGQDVSAATSAVDSARLRQLTAGSMLLSCLWEARTHLRRLYGLMNNQSSRRESKTKVNAKDLNKAPTKVPFASGDKFWDESTKIMAALGSPEAMMDRCKAFVDLLTVDPDFKIAAEGEDDIAARAKLTTPSDDEASQPPGGSGGGRKRRAAGTPGGRKKRARSSSKNRGRKNKRGSVDSDEDDDY
jgi:cohesin loading factor subunit SCC2